ncbi:MAG TPA: hypothetical protein VIC84_18555 [Blastocatellia bacterium]|jgi:hypothetical protein
MTKPNRIFAMICLVSAIILAAYIFWARTRSADNTDDAPKNVASAVEAASPDASRTTDANPPPAAAPEPNEKKAGGEPAQPDAEATPDNSKNKTSRQIFFRYNGVDGHYSQLAFAPYEHLDQPHFIESLSCEAAYVAGGRGICLSANRGLLTTYTAKLFDATTFKVIAELPLNGVPSRCRMSSDGKLAALTVFIRGHGYDSVSFTTQTLLIEVDGGRTLADLEQFSVSKDGQPFSNKDFNFWGVTFTPGARHFYATLSTNHRHFLIKGDVANRTATVIHENVECPSLSPNASKIAYKKRSTVDGRVIWQLHILDLKTDQETPLGEKRSVDDQLEWLDNNHVLYSLPETGSASTDVWIAAADGASAPRLFLKKAYSPSAAVLP